MSAHPIPLAALDDRLGYFGTAGSGKTYNAGSGVERLLRDGKRCIIPDPLGVWWGLRLLADGKQQSSFDVVIFGGPHGDLPLTEHVGALIGETVAGMKESCILDLSALGTKAAERRFMLAFLTALYKHATGEPMHVVFDEADMWAPQQIRDRDQEPAKLLGMMETIVRRGRVKGFVPWLISQRPAVLNKDVMSQIDGMVAFKLTSSQDRVAIGEWVKGQADIGQWNEIWKSLPTLERGQGVVWLPARDTLRTARFPEKVTFDSSRTPKRGEKVLSQAKLKPLNLEKLRERLAAVEVETKANDPARLKAELAKLKKDLAGRGIDRSEINDAEKRGFERGMQMGLRAGFERTRHQLHNLVAQLTPNLEGVPTQVVMSRSTSAPKIVPAIRSKEQPEAKAINGHVSLPPGERAVLIAAVQYNGVDRDQLSVLTDYKRSSRDAYIQRLREKGYVELQGQVVVPVPSGIAALGDDYTPLPVGADLQVYWNARLPEGERKILSELVAAYPNSVARPDLDETTGYKRSSRDAYIQRLKSRRLLTTEGSHVRAAETLF